MITSSTRAAYDQWLGQGLALDLTRGKPCAEQLDLANDLLNPPVGGFLRSDGDVRNYGGGPQGLLELREIFAPLLQVPVDQLCAADNSSLALMYQAVITSFIDAPSPDAAPWRSTETPVFLCPVPGYDRHFGVTADLGVDMVPVPTDEHGPVMDVVESLVAENPNVKGLWIVPKYSNPSGWTVSDDVVRRLATMPVAAPDFRIYWDNAYAVHHLTETHDELADLLAACADAGNPDRAFVFGSTSKITLAGAGVSFFGSSPANVEWWVKHLRMRSIGPDRINQAQHADFFGDAAGVLAHMDKHRAILAPKFDAVQQALATRLSEIEGISWTRPNGGYFVSLDVRPGTAARVVELAGAAGVKLTPAGAPFPYGVDPLDANIRIAPSFPGRAELERALAVLTDSVALASVEAE